MSKKKEKAQLLSKNKPILGSTKCSRMISSVKLRTFRFSFLFFLMSKKNEKAQLLSKKSLSSAILVLCYKAISLCLIEILF